MASPEQYAENVLANIGWDGALPIDPVRVAKCYGIEVLRDQEMVGSSSSGHCVTTDEDAKLILVNPEDPIPRQRFTVAHELGHALLDQPGVHERSGKSRNLAAYRAAEARINRFAAALLMPEESVIQANMLGKDLDEMARLFDVSPTAMRIRLVRLGILPDA